MELNLVFNEMEKNLLAEEGITEDDLSLVDLDIEYTPVIPIRGAQPMEAVKLRGGNYAVPECPLVGTSISPKALTVMRYRYLTSRDRFRYD